MFGTSGILAVLSPRRILAAAFVTFVVLVLSPVLIGYVHFSEALHKAFDSYPRLLPTLFQHGRPRSEMPTLDIVVSMYQENVTQLAEKLNTLRSLRSFEHIDIRTIIYTKDEDASLAAIHGDTNATAVFKLSNAGREGGTYLSHILLNWENLARHTLFMQAEVHQSEEVFRRISYNFNSRTGVLPLNHLETCDCRDCSDPWDKGSKYPRLAQLYSALNSQLCPEQITLSYSGQIIVSAERIKQRKKEIYEHLKEVLESGGDHWIHGDDRQDWRFADEKSNPFFGHTIERSYMVLWNCSDVSIVDRCRRWDEFLNDGAPLDPGVPGWCQCLDGEA